MSRCAALVNPARIADADGLRRRITQLLAAEGWPAPDWYLTSTASAVDLEAREALASGVEVLLVCGGDGTVRQAAEVAAGTDVALALLPLGTGNVLALNLELPRSVEEAVALVTRGERRRIDLGVVDGHCFTVAAGMGMDAEMLEQVSPEAKHRLGWFAYAAVLFRLLLRPGFEVTIGLDSRPSFTRTVRSVLVANVGRLPGGLNLAPAARLDDGQLDLAVVAAGPLRHWLGELARIALRRPAGRQVETFRARTVEIGTRDLRQREVDGDLLPAGRRLDASIRAGALLVCVPPSRAPAATSA